MSKSFLKLSKLLIQFSTTCKTCERIIISSRLSSTVSKWHGLWEPSDLKLEPDIPEFKALNIHMKGYDYPVLESYAKYVHRTVTKIFNLESDAYPSPSKSAQVRTFHQNSTAVNEKYDINTFERIVMVENVSSTTVPLLLQFIQKNCPEGVMVTLKEPDQNEEEFRFVPDYDIKQLKAEKESLESGKLKKKK